MRMPAVADRFYPYEEDETEAILKYCFCQVKDDYTDNARPKAVVAPHAGYIFSGICAAYSFKRLSRGEKPEAYIVIGPDHYGCGYSAVTCSDNYWTPFGECEVAWDIISDLQKHIPDVPPAHQREHSIEVELPFLKYIDPGARIVPIIMGDQSRDMAMKLSEIISDVTKEKDVQIIASSDLVHYVPRDYAEKEDNAFMKIVSSMDVDGIYSAVKTKRLSVCGYGPIATQINATKPTSGEVLFVTDSSQSRYSDQDSVVGYGQAAFY